MRRSVGRQRLNEKFSFAVGADLQRAGDVFEAAEIGERRIDVVSGHIADFETVICTQKHPSHRIPSCRARTRLQQFSAPRAVSNGRRISAFEALRQIAQALGRNCDEPRRSIFLRLQIGSNSPENSSKAKSVFWDNMSLSECDVQNPVRSRRHENVSLSAAIAFRDCVAFRPASAHAFLSSASLRADSTISSSPAQVVLNFTEKRERPSRVLK
jgi:hypothetical protein